MIRRPPIQLIEHPDYTDEWLLISYGRIKSGDTYFYRCGNGEIHENAEGDCNYDLEQCSKIISSTVFINKNVSLITKAEIKAVALITYVTVRILDRLFNRLHSRVKT